MPTAIVATVGSASANSYVTMEEAAAYFGDRLNVSAWETAAGGDDQTKALLMATKRLERELWLGNRVSSTQALSWPRYGVEKIDAVTGVNNGYYGFDQYDADEIPQQVKDAQCELALSLLAGYGQQSGGSSSGTIKSFSADGFSVTFGSTRSEQSLPENTLRLIAPLIRGAQLVRA